MLTCGEITVRPNSYVINSKPKVDSYIITQPFAAQWMTIQMTQLIIESRLKEC